MYRTNNGPGDAASVTPAGCRAVRCTFVRNALAAAIAFLVLLPGGSAYSEMNWKKAVSPTDFSPRAAHGILSYDNKLWIFSGNSTVTATNALCTSDGTNWTKLADTVGFKLGSYYGYAVFKNSMWIIGGEEIEDG